MLQKCNKLIYNKSFKSIVTLLHRKINVLGIETSCDDTGIAIVRHDGNGENKVLANILNSQQSFHIRWVIGLIKQT